MPRNHRNIHPSQAELIAALELRHSGKRLRFDEAFLGSTPVQAGGRIGNEYFYFRFRHDTATLTVGKPDRPSVDSGRQKRLTQKMRRRVRRGTADQFEKFLMSHRSTRLARHPSRVRLRASIHDVTGEEYAGHLEPEKAAQLFDLLLSRLETAAPRLPAKAIRRFIRGGRSEPMNQREGVIRESR